jgi:hypothetical protein
MPPLLQPASAIARDLLLLRHLERGGSRELLPQRTVLDDVAYHRTPVLILGSAGIGKSVLVESFACQMAADTRYATSGIPLLVRLRDFNRLPREEIGIRSMLEEAERLVFGPDEVPLFSKAEIALLIHSGMVVPMFDGFDEFSHRDLFCGLLARAQRNPELLMNCTFLVTSRPDADIVKLPIERTCRFILQPLLEHEVREYVTEKCGISSENLSTTPPMIRRLLTQPLYMCVWCNSISRGHNPRTPGDLMHELFVEYLERRELVKSIADCGDDGQLLVDRQKDIEYLHDLIARVCGQLATFGFGTRVRLSTLSGVSAQEMVRLRSVVRRAAIIERIPHPSGDDELYLNKIPIVEYFIGWNLSYGCREGCSQTQITKALDSWRRWACMPEMHDVLDHFFFSLWHSPSQTAEPLAENLIRWLCNLSRFDPASRDVDSDHSIKGPEVHDDLAHPFCVSALRWINLSPNRDLLELTCSTVAMMVRRRRCYEQFRYLCTLSPLLTPRTINALISALGDEYRSNANVQMRDMLTWCIFSFAKEVAPDSAGELVNSIFQLMPRLPEDSGATQAELHLYRAIVAACERIPSAKVMTWIRTWTQLILNDSLSTETVRYAICAIGCCISNAQDDEVAAWLFEWSGTANGEPGSKRVEPWTDLFWKSAREFPTKQRLLVIRRVLGRLSKTADGNGISAGDIKLLCDLTSSRLTHCPLDIISDLITLLKQAPRELADDICRILNKMAWTIDHSSALNCIHLLLATAMSDECSYLGAMMGDAIESTAARVAEDAADECVTLLRAAASQVKHQGLRSWVNSGIVAAARQMAKTGAKGFVCQLLQEAAVESDGETRRSIGNAVRGAATRIPTPEALQCLNAWIADLRESELNGTSTILMDAISGVSEGVAGQLGFNAITDVLAKEFEHSSAQAIRVSIGKAAVIGGRLSNTHTSTLKFAEDLFRKLYSPSDIACHLDLALCIKRLVGECFLFDRPELFRQLVDAALFANPDSREEFSAAVRICAERASEDIAQLCLEIVPDAMKVCDYHVRNNLISALRQSARRVPQNCSFNSVQTLIAAAEAADDSIKEEWMVEAALHAAMRLPVEDLVKVVKDAIEKRRLAFGFALAGSRTEVVLLAHSDVVDSNVAPDLRIVVERRESFEIKWASAAVPLAIINMMVKPQVAARSVDEPSPGAAVADVALLVSVDWPDWYQRTSPQIKVDDAKRLLKHFGFPFTRQGHDSERLVEILTKEAETLTKRQVRVSGKGPGRRIDREDLEKLITAKVAASAASRNEKKS